MNIEFAEVYKAVVQDMDKEYCCKHLLYSPRCSGKSSALGKLIYIYYLAYPKYDIAIGVDSISNAGEGVLSEFVSYLETEGLNNNGEWITAKRTVYKKGCNNQIRVYAVQANALQNVNVSKGKKLIRPCSLFVMDEVQKLHSKQILTNAISTFLRQMKAGHSKVILAGNPDRRAMWFTEYYNQKKQGELDDVDNGKVWATLCPTYKDLWGWIPKALQDEILLLKELDPIEYAQVYLGDIDIAGWEQTFHSFDTARHYIDRKTLIDRDSRNYLATMIQSIVIGVDDARARDALVATCITNHGNGQIRVQETLYSSQKEKPIKPALTERIAMLVEYLDYIQLHFNSERQLPMYIVIDNASDLATQLRVQAKTDPSYMRWRGVRIYEYSQKQDKETQLDTVNASFANGVLSVVNVDNYSPHYSNKIMVEQIKALRYLDNHKIDPNIPNDCTDALQYGVMTILSNPYNLTLPRRRERYDSDNSANAFVDKLNYGDFTI